MARTKKIGGSVKSFNLSFLAQQRLTEIAKTYALSESQTLSKILEEQEVVDFDTKKKIDALDEELKGLQLKQKQLIQQARELEDKKDELSKLGKQGKVLDKIMKSKTDEAITNLVEAFERQASRDAIDRIALEGHRRTGISAPQLIIMAAERWKK